MLGGVKQGPTPYGLILSKVHLGVLPQEPSHVLHEFNETLWSFQRWVINMIKWRAKGYFLCASVEFIEGRNHIRFASFSTHNPPCFWT